VLDFLTRCRLPVTESLLHRFYEVLHSPDVVRPTNAAPERTHSGEVRHVRHHARMHRGRLARAVDHMVDRVVIAERHGDHVVEPYLRPLRRLDRPAARGILWAGHGPLNSLSATSRDEAEKAWVLILDPDSQAEGAGFANVYECSIPPGLIQLTGWCRPAK